MVEGITGHDSKTNARSTGRSRDSPSAGPVIPPGMESRSIERTSVGDRTASDVFATLKASDTSRDVDAILGDESLAEIIDRADEPVTATGPADDLFDDAAFDAVIIPNRKPDGEFVWVELDEPNADEPDSTVEDGMSNPAAGGDQARSDRTDGSTRADRSDPGRVDHDALADAVQTFRSIYGADEETEPAKASLAEDNSGIRTTIGMEPETDVLSDASRFRQSPDERTRLATEADSETDPSVTPDDSSAEPEQADTVSTRTEAIGGDSIRSDPTSAHSIRTESTGSVPKRYKSTRDESIGEEPKSEIRTWVDSFDDYRADPEPSGWFTSVRRFFSRLIRFRGIN